MSKMQQLQFWSDDGPLDDARLPAAPVEQSASKPTVEPRANPTHTKDGCPVLNDPHAAELVNSVHDSPPLALPLPGAVAEGVFGLTEDGPIEPDDEEIRALTDEHSRELLATLADLESVEDGIRTGEDPRTGKIPRTAEARVKLAEFLERESKRLKSAYGNALAAYTDGFGDVATAALDLWVRRNVAGSAPSVGRYDPGHPWHYFSEGDAAPPIPVDEIDADLDAGRGIERDLPKNRSKRIQRMRELLEHERQRVEEDRIRYEDIVQRGAEALSRYDREISHTSDEMARASALSLKYNHIRFGLGRVAWLRKQLGINDAPLLQSGTTKKFGTS